MLLGAGMVAISFPPIPPKVALGVCLVVAGLALGARAVAVQTRPQTDYRVAMELVPAPEPATATPMPFPGQPPTPTPGRNNRATVQIQGRDITASNIGAVRDTRNGGYMLSFSWSQTEPISAKEGRRQLANLWVTLTPEQQHRRDNAYYSAVAWITESVSHSPPGRFAGEHFAYQNRPGKRDDVWDARVDVSVFEGVAFDRP